ncbi:hypothetical protein M5K25_011042 [Dendrobium thyrsiflorum]|uniref:DUF4283 domain-containing protein n=1 Tax=Dendrobium thyrsiflorum TaxID=117978 RepID=A0ABD0V2U0_DENTH
MSRLSLKLSGDFSATLLNLRHILLKLSNDMDYSRIFARGTYYVNICFMKLIKWSPFFDIGEESSVIPIWFSLPDLRLQLFSHRILFGLRSLFGRPFQTDNATTLGSRQSIAHILVKLDITKKYPSQRALGMFKGGYEWSVNTVNALAMVKDAIGVRSAIQDNCKSTVGTGQEQNQAKFIRENSNSVNLVVDLPIASIEINQNLPSDMGCTDYLGKNLHQSWEDILVPFNLRMAGGKRSRQEPGSSSSGKSYPRFLNAEDKEAYARYKSAGLTISKTINPATLSYPGEAGEEAKEAQPEQAPDPVPAPAPLRQHSQIDQLVERCLLQREEMVLCRLQVEAKGATVLYRLQVEAKGVQVLCLTELVENNDIHYPQDMQNFRTWAQICNTNNIVWERLDRILFNNEWISCFPMSIVNHLSKTSYDHNPLLMLMKEVLSSCFTPFHFQNMWVLSFDFSKVVKDIWLALLVHYEGDNHMITLALKLKRVK